METVSLGADRYCAGGGIRTHTDGFLGPGPLPLGYAGLR